MAKLPNPCDSKLRFARPALQADYHSGLQFCSEAPNPRPWISDVDRMRQVSDLIDQHLNGQYHFFRFDLRFSSIGGLLSLRQRVAE